MTVWACGGTPVGAPPALFGIANLDQENRRGRCEILGASATEAGSMRCADAEREKGGQSREKRRPMTTNDDLAAKSSSLVVCRHCAAAQSRSRLAFFFGFALGLALCAAGLAFGTGLAFGGGA